MAMAMKNTIIPRNTTSDMIETIPVILFACFTLPGF
jgi:hypothetical protein